MYTLVRVAESMADVAVSVNEETDRMIACAISNPVTSGGWSPPVDTRIVPSLSAQQVASWIDDGKYHEGEMADWSAICVHKQHPNTPNAVRQGEEIVLEGLIRFRAGAHTDNMGITEAGSPFHVPWVWSDVSVVYLGKGKFRAHALGSAFPTHKLFIDGEAKALQLQAKVEAVSTDPTLSTGLPATDLQSNKNEAVVGPIDKAPNTIPAGKLVRPYVFSPKPEY